MSLADGCCEWAFEGDVVSCDRVDGLIWDLCLAVLKRGCHVHALPLDRRIGCGEDILDRLGDFRPNAVAFYERDEEFAVAVFLAFEVGYFFFGGDCVGS